MLLATWPTHDANGELPQAPTACFHTFTNDNMGLKAALYYDLVRGSFVANTLDKRNVQNLKTSLNDCDVSNSPALSLESVCGFSSLRSAAAHKLTKLSLIVLKP